MILYLYRMTVATIQDLSQSWNLLSSISQKNPKKQNKKNKKNGNTFFPFCIKEWN